MDRGEKPFTAAHQVQGLDKVSEMVDFILEHNEEIATRLLDSNSLEESCNTIKIVPHLGRFTSWQIMCDFMEIKILKHPEDSFRHAGTWC